LYGSLKKPSVLNNKIFIGIVFYHPKAILIVSDESIEKLLKKEKTLTKPKKVKTFVWEPTESCNLEPRFFTGLSCFGKIS
jgi:hypothetical protein